MNSVCSWGISSTVFANVEHWKSPLAFALFTNWKYRLYLAKSHLWSWRQSISSSDSTSSICMSYRAPAVPPLRSHWEFAPDLNFIDVPMVFETITYRKSHVRGCERPSASSSSCPRSQLEEATLVTRFRRYTFLRKIKTSEFDESSGKRAKQCVKTGFKVRGTWRLLKNDVNYIYANEMI